jgi:O-antigen ligase
MLKRQSEPQIAKVVGIGAFITTIIVGAWWGTDPVNVPKLFTLTITAAISLALFLVGFDKKLLKSRKPLYISLICFLFLSFLSTIFSTEAVLMSFYGVFGRNNGFLSYLSLAILFFIASQFQNRHSFNVLLKAFYFSGLFNVAYCGLSIAGIELIPWNNIFNTILGTFGNPNFIGAFLGMFATYLFSTLFDRDCDIRVKAFNFVVWIVTCYQILYSNAIQGIIVALGGCALVLFFFIRTYPRMRVFTALYSITVLFVGMVSALGALQIGPLTELIYKASVSLRGEYWQAGINMGLSNPFLGVGMDSYGAWYRQSRDASALVFPGPDTITNAAHNVAIDIFASGGFPLLISYLLILGFTFLSIIRGLKRSKQFDSTFVALVSIWLGYQVQSLVSINQIGLSIWGWILGGAIIGYEQISYLDKEPQNQKLEGKKGVIGKKYPRKEAQSSTVVAVFVGSLVGGLIALPPLAADIKWRSALSSGSQEQLESAVVQFPTVPTRLAEGVQIFAQNNLPDLARKYALILTEKYPNNFNSWEAYAQLTDLTQEEKSLILENLRRLDPLNPKIKSND